MLWARVGIPYSPATGLPIESQTISQMVDRVLALPEGTRLYILAPVVQGRKGEYRKEIADWMKRGFQRLKIDGKYYEISDTPTLDKKFKHDIDVVVDRVVVRADIGQRLAESFETALKLAEGMAVAEFADGGEKAEGKRLKGTHAEERMIFSEKFACPVSGFTIAEIEPRLFSFNNPFGACPKCGGLGVEQHIDADLVIPDRDTTLRKGAIAPWSRSTSPYYTQTLEALAKHYKFTLDTKWKALPKKTQDAILYGSGEDDIKFVYDDGMRSYTTKKPFEGVVTNLERRFRETESDWARDELQKYFTDIPCEACKGYRLKPEALCVKIGGMHIGEVSEMSVRKAGEWFAAIPEKLTKQQNEIAVRVLKEIRDRLRFLVDVGLDYLTLSRGSGTLSGGESQRIRLASQIGSGLTGVLYVLDEPSIGLHQRDNARLLETLKRLRDLGNTVIVVEHDEDAIRLADYVVDVGPGAGVHGGKIVAQGTPGDVMSNKHSLTGRYLTGELGISIPERRAPDWRRSLKVINARGHNLKNVTAEIPLGLFTASPASPAAASPRCWSTRSTSRSRASSTMRATRPPRMTRSRGSSISTRSSTSTSRRSAARRAPIRRPIPARSRRSANGLPDCRKSKRAAMSRAASRSTSRAAAARPARATACIKIEMHFLPDVYVTCDTCKGKRYNRETLEVTFKQKSIADILDMTVDEAADFFKAVPRIRDILTTLQRVGLGYIHVGQQATTLSGGEAQRVKLAKELSKRATGRTLYILDEPTTGLHFHDVAKLLDVLHELVASGNSVVVIEHNLEVIKTADWIIDLGPEGGDGGGEIVAAGPPEEIVKEKRSYTGQFLKPVLARRDGGKKKRVEAAE